jgi:hypothetical protein
MMIPGPATTFDAPEASMPSVKETMLRCESLTQTYLSGGRELAV